MSVVPAAYALWIGFLATWWAAALWTAPARSRGPIANRLGYFAGFALGFGLLFTPPAALFASHGVRAGLSALLPHGWQVPFWPEPRWLGRLLVFTELVAFAFAWWARLHLGRLWSGMLTLREGHRVVDSGPYRLVRHPIYTGFIAASWSLALLVATGAAMLGAGVLTLVMSVKAKAEERLLRRELGSAAYDDYAARTPMLIPLA